MNNFFYTLKIIYTNRFRQLTYKDSSAFWIPLIAYFLLMFKIVNGSFPTFPIFDIRPYVLLNFSFFTSQFINQRNDWDLLKNLFNTKKTYLIYLVDLTLLNSLNLAVSIYFGWIYFTLLIIAVILFFTFYKARINQPIIKLPFKILDVLTVIQLRRFKLHYLVFAVLYYISYQSIIEENKNLFIGCISGFIFILLTHQQKTEKLEYFISSKLSNKKYIIKNEIAFIINNLIIISPCLIMSIFYDLTYFLVGIISLSLIFITFPIKYIFLNQQIPIALISFLFIVYFLTIMLDEEIDYLMLITILPLSFILHLIVFRKFTKQKITEDSEFYF